MSDISSTVDLQVRQPPTLVTVDGTPLLVYELHLVNFVPHDLTVQRVEILDAQTQAPIAVPLDDPDDLDQRLTWFAAAEAGRAGRRLAPAIHAVLYLEVPVTGDAVPAALEHRLTLSGPVTPSGSRVIVQGGQTPVRTAPPVVLAPPVHGGPWAALYHPSWVQGHRRFIYALDGRARIPGRFTVDWLLLDADGRAARGEADVVANWFGHGADVLAVADGVVVATRDDIPESDTISGHPKLPLADATGNYVTLDLGGGQYAFYEHLRPGVPCRPGDRVRRGQVVGSLGFTGHTISPHLCFHVADATSALAAEGLPFILDSFTLRGTYDSVEKLGTAPWVPVTGDTRMRHRECPQPLAVVEFATTDT